MDQIVKAPTDTEYVDLSVVAMLRVIRRHWVSFLFFLVICTGLSVAAAFLTAPVYKSTTLISPVTSSPLTGGGAISRLAMNFGFGGMGIGQQRNSRAVGMAALSSPYFTRAFIQERNLLPILFYELWDSDNEEWLVDDPDDIPTLQEGYELFADEVIEVEEDRLGGLVEVSISWIDPAIAAKWANDLVQTVNERLRNQAIQDADLTIKYLNEELARTTAVELQQALYLLVESEIEKRTSAKVQQEYSFKVLSPATPSDLDKWESPNRVFVICAGILLGIFFGMLFAILLEPTKRVLRESGR